MPHVNRREGHRGDGVGKEGEGRGVKGLHFECELLAGPQVINALCEHAVYGDGALYEVREPPAPCPCQDVGATHRLLPSLQLGLLLRVDEHQQLHERGSSLPRFLRLLFPDAKVTFV